MIFCMIEPLRGDDQYGGTWSKEKAGSKEKAEVGGVLACMSKLSFNLYDTHYSLKLYLLI